MAVSKRQIGYAALVFLALATLFLFIDRDGQRLWPRSVQALWNLGHIAYFFVLVVLLRRANFLSFLSGRAQWGAYLVATLLLGVLIEIIQMTPRVPIGWMDVARDLAGTLMALLFTLEPDNATRGRWMAFLIAMIAATPFMKSLSDEIVASVRFPVLADFETPFELSRWVSRLPIGVAKPEQGNANNALKIELDRGKYAGVSLIHFPADWSRFKRLEISVFLPGTEPLTVTLRVHDRRHQSGRIRFAYSDRFNRSFQLEPGWNHLSVSLAEVESAPAKRRMDMGEIANLALFAVRLGQPRVIFIDNLRLSDQ